MFKEKDSGHKNSNGKDLAPSGIPRKLTARDLALGMGRKAKDEELEEYLNRPHGTAVPFDKAVERIKSKLQKRRQSRKWK